LQDCEEVLEVVHGSESETCPASTDDGNDGIVIKVEGTDTQEQENPMPITFAVIKVDSEVSCMSLRTLLSAFHRYLLT
jgi:hypothetical protein